MARIKVDLDQETYLAVLNKALLELRPMNAQVVVLLRQALGLKFPYEEEHDIPYADAIAGTAQHAPSREGL